MSNTACIRYTIFTPQIGIFDEKTRLRRARAYEESPMREFSAEVTYQAVSTSELDIPNQRIDTKLEREILGRVFDLHNSHPGETSLSKGDVVTLEKVGTYLCCSMGWAELAGYQADRFPVGTEGEVPPSEAEAEYRAHVRATWKAGRGTPPQP